jgi:hypothetical protein
VKARTGYKNFSRCKDILLLGGPVRRQTPFVAPYLVHVGINNMTYYIALSSRGWQYGSTPISVIMPRTSPYQITLTDSERVTLEEIARKYTSPYFNVVRAKAILMAARGLRNDQIAQRVSLPRQIVSKWRKRFFEERLEGLENLPRSGRPPSFSP